MEQRTAGTVRDVDEASFQAEVVQVSHARPVVVDFWAAWCGPCHQLSPLLEKAAERHAGEVEVVKVDVDRAQGLARAFGVQGIPAVKAFRDGQVVREFTGVQPEPVIAQFFAALVPSEAERLTAAATAAVDDGERERLLDQALAASPDHPPAAVAKARLLATRGEVGQARGLLDRLPGNPEAERLQAELALADQHVDEAGLDRLRAAADSGDPAARVSLGRALAASGRHDDALEALVAAVRHPATREEARAAALEVFALLGPEHETVLRWRPRLASALF